MKRFLSIAALLLAAGPAVAQVSIGISEPGIFGRIDLGGFGPPQLLNAQPVYAQRPPGRDLPPPIYLHVPAGYERHWRDHCREYDACGQPVYFVRDDWYRTVYRPRFRQAHGYDHGDRRVDERDDHRGDRGGPPSREERRDGRNDGGRGDDRDRGDGDRGPGNGRDR